MNSYRNFGEREGKRVKSVLKTYGHDLVEQAGELELVIGRDTEIQEMCLILSSTTRRNNPLLIGESGVGKTAIVKEFAQRISRGNVPDTLNGVRVIALDAWVLAAGGRECRKIQRAISEEVDRNVICFIDDIHLVFKAKRSGDAKIFLRDILRSSEMRCIGATTPKEFRKYIEKDDAGFCSWFWEVLVAEPSVNDTISILRGLKQRYQAYHGVRILDSALEAAAKLSERYITAWCQPDKAIDTLDEACASLAVQLQSKPEEINDLEIKSRRLQSEFGSLENQGDKASKARLVEIGKELVSLRDELQPLLMKYKKDQERRVQIRKLKEKRTEVLVDIRKAGKGCSEAKVGGLIYGQLERIDKEIAELEGTMDKKLVTVGPNQIAQAVSQKIGIPVRLGTHDDEWLIGLAQRLLERVVGQDQAVEAVTGALMKSAFFGSAQNPIGSFLFVGPPGVGKTLAKALTEELFDDEKLMIRNNMSEYTKERSASRLIGSAYRYPGKLTEAVKKRPHSVVLLDEVDKAHPRVLDIFRPVLDGGYLTDDDGRVNFNNTIIIMTSNIGAKYLIPGISENSVEEAISKVMEEVNKHFDPGLLNRLNDIVVFNPVCDDQLKDVANGLAEPGEPAQALKKPKMF